MTSKVTALKPATTKRPKPRAPALGARVARLEKRLAKPVFSSKLEQGITVMVGAGIPLFNLGVSTAAGSLAKEGHMWLGASLGAVLIVALIVSLSHLAYAFEAITGSSKRASWALAIAVDTAIVVCEIVQVYAAEAAGWTALAVMVGALAVSCVLNVYAFVAHAAERI